MSTYWGFACISHDPPLISEHWFNHGEETLIDAFIQERAGQWPNDARPEVDLLDLPEPVVSRGGYATEGPIHWLREHPRCEVVLHNEYGDTRPIGETIAGSPLREPRALTA